MAVTFAWLADHYLPVGLAIGIAAAAPIGPVNILVIQHSIARGLGAGLLLGLGAAVGDALFALVAAFGFTALADLVNAHGDPMRLVGGCILIGFAVLLWQSAPHLDASGGQPSRQRRLMLATLLMTITNPATLLWFAGAFGSVGFHAIGHATLAHMAHSALVVLGVFLGSMLWWLGIALIAQRLRTRLDDGHLVLINHVAAVILALSGLAALIAGVHKG